MNNSLLKLYSLRFFVCLASLLVAFSAAAQSAPPSHKDLSPSEQQQLVGLLDAGQSAFDAGDFDKALVSFRDAYAIFGHPDITYKIARCYEYLGELPEAITTYQQFLTDAPNAEERGRVERTIAALKERRRESLPATLQLSVVPADAKVYVDGQRKFDASGGTGRFKIGVTPGSHDVRVEKRGYQPKNHPLSLSAGESKALTITIEKVPTPQVEPSNDWVGPVLLGSAGAIAGVFAAFSYTQYASNSDQIARWDELKDAQQRPAQYDSVHNEMNTDLTVTWTAGIISAACLTTAAVWWWGYAGDARAATATTSGVTVDSVALGPGGTDPRATNSEASALDNWSLSMSGRF